MAVQRFISTSFWDDAWIQELDLEDKLLYMYLLTNPLTNIAGVYEITKRRISFDTGYPMDTLCMALNRFSEAGKAHYFDEKWIILPNWPKHQRATERNTIRSGIDAVLKALPDEVWSYLNTTNYAYDFLSEIDRKVYPMDTLCITPTGVPSYIDTDTDTDTDDDDTRVRAREKKQSSSTKKIFSDPLKLFIDQYNSVYQPKRDLTLSSFDDKMISMLNKMPPDKIPRVFECVRGNKFLLSRSSPLIVLRHWPKILEGAYQPFETQEGHEEIDSSQQHQDLKKLFRQSKGRGL